MPRKPIDPKTQALKLLARREHSGRELKRKLAARGITAEDAASAVADVASEGWQSDDRYAAMLVRSRVAHGYGPMRIRAELQMAGLSREEIEAALAAAGVDWCEHASLARAKKFRQLPKTSAERAKQYRYLQGRGFDGSQIGAALKGTDDED
jgi:regulatory protein